MNISLEFFPPKTEQAQFALLESAGRLNDSLSLQYGSVTYGAGGSTREGTLQTVRSLQAVLPAVAPHVSCIGAAREELHELLKGYLAQGIHRVVALRGDLPSGYGQAGAFAHAVDLVRFVREAFGDAFEIEVAAYPEVHPQARSAQDDLRHFVDKVKAGATGAITQYFFNSDAYFRFVDEAHRLGADVPVIPGIMPITNYSQLARFSDACGAEIPRWIRLRLAGYGDDLASIRAFGEEVVTDLVDQLTQAGVPGIHFYTMNRAEPTLAILKALGLTRPGSEIQ